MPQSLVMSEGEGRRCETCYGQGQVPTDDGLITCPDCGGEGRLASPATQAKIFKSPKPGVRGEAILDLKVSGGPSGTIAGQFDLTAAQVQELAASRYYVQLSSEKAAEGNLWGWLMPQQEKGR